MKIACVQMTSACDPADNLPIIAARVKQAAAQSARLVALPETCSFMEKNRKAMHSRLENQADSQVLAALCHMAKENGIFLLIGSMILAEENSDKAVNRSLLIAPNGTVQAQYDKIHMFDADVGDGKQYRESEHFKPGDAVIHYKTAIGHIGLSICYDIRFPNLYRQLGQAGTEIITIPAAFTQTTGAAHWHVLQRARAIETGSFILAAAQCGRHADGRQTYGHSLIINPWGKILADAGDRANSFVKAEIDLNEVNQARAALRHLQHQPHYS